MKEFEAFRSVYCGLCHQLGKSFGPPARFTLNYDFVFLAMLGYAASDLKPRIERGRCAANPLKRVPLCRPDEVLAFSADAAALMIYYNLMDKIEDGGLFAKLGYSLLRPFAAGAGGKAAKRRPEAARVIRQLSAEQKAVEAGGEAGIDQAAEPTATALGAIFRDLSQDAGQRRVLERLGYLTGRVIYLCDALDDLDADLKKNSFNPLINRFLRDADTPEARREARGYAKQSLYMTIGEAGRTCNLLEMNSFAPVIENIVYLGLTEQVDRVMKRYTDTEKEAQPEQTAAGADERSL
jgi:hypothetical protein